MSRFFIPKFRTVCQNCTSIFQSSICSYSFNYIIISFSFFFKDNNPCSSSPCLNNGLCSLDDLSCSYQCSCQQGFTGTTCGISATSTTTFATTTESDACVSSPCLNNGLCISFINSYQCLCLPDFSGPTCQIQI